MRRCCDRLALTARRPCRRLRQSTFGNHPFSFPAPLTNWKILRAHTAAKSKQWGKNMIGNGEAILENVRRYRAIASLYRQTAAFRPLQKWSLLDQAEEWEHLAVAELESYFNFGERLKMPFTNSAAITIGTG
jgi:hypothetical protein